ncbi:MAG: AHH domain-containing protein [Lachnospiraceae bacterium]|nr:AHH domain-containing protein [Lachnospiraceae bacterium]
MEKCITKAGSEKVISFAEKKSQAEESKWETIGGARIRRPNTELQKPHVVRGDTVSIYAGESTLTDNRQNGTVVEKVIHFLWDGNTILHEWVDDANSSKKPHQKIDFQADYVTELSEKKEQAAKENTSKGEPAPESLVTWIFQDDFIPRAKLTKDGCYSIFTDYLGTPVGAYDEAGNLVWERELDINGKVMSAGKDNYGRTLQDIGEKTFIPFRFQGQYEDEETGLYYNRFRYYDPETGQYTQQDPIGLAGGNPTLYGYVYNTLGEIDPFGLDRMPSWMKTRQGWQRHHLIPSSIWDKYPILRNSGMSVNGATNMTYLPVAEGIDLINPQSSLHKGWNDMHKLYNEYMAQEVEALAKMATENNWDKSRIQQEIRNLQSDTKSSLKGGTIKCH